MTRLLLAGLLALMLATVAGAQQNCTTFTVIQPDGSVQIWSKCCYSSGNCVVTCISGCT
jgi:hypothetical protein